MSLSAAFTQSGESASKPITRKADVKARSKLEKFMPMVSPPLV
jgi:hypothetical protein